MPATEAEGASASAPTQPSQSGPAMQVTPLVQGITPPKPLDTTGNVVDDWKQFKQVWNNYSIITNLGAQTEDYRVALFFTALRQKL